VAGSDCLIVRYFEDQGEDRLLIVNFRLDLNLTPAPEPLLALPPGRTWEFSWSSNRLEYGGLGGVSPLTDNGWLIPGESASVLIASHTEMNVGEEHNSEPI
jgi:maltooligosyltrehalose trehalohydrolase